MKLNLRSVDLNLLPVFDTIMVAGQLSRAAAQLGMSQPAVSAALQRLRLTLRDELFVRTRQGLQPTPRARELHPQVRAALDLLRDSIDPRNAFDPATSRRRFRIMGDDNLETTILPRLLAVTSKEAPGIQLETIYSPETLVSAIARAEVDLCIDPLPPDDDRLSREILTHVTLVVVARNDHPRIRTACTPELFMEEEHAVLPTRQGGLQLDQIVQQPDWQRRIGARVSLRIGQLTACAQSDMLATVPERLARRYASGMGLNVFPFPFKMSEVPVYMLWPSALDQDAAHQWIRQTLRKMMR